MSEEGSSDWEKRIPRGTVWILGAGFSRSLGGPLLGDLFTPALYLQIEAWIEQNKATRGKLDNELAGFREVSELFRGRVEWPAQITALTMREPENSGKFAKPPWQNAEEFLETLDRAVGVESDADARVATQLLCSRTRKQGHANYDARQTDAKRLRDDARKYLLAATEYFLLSGDVNRVERWSPYTRWAQQLDGDKNVVLSFNYDRVVERASKREEEETERIAPLRPCDGYAEAADQLDKRKSSKSLLFVKLHGSADWYLENDMVKPCCSAEDILIDKKEPAIAAPGPTKLQRTKESYELLWKVAEASLRKANRIVFLGYSLPATDNEAKRRILDAIQCNRPEKSGEWGLPVHIVLGSDTNHRDVRRLKGMTEWALTRSDVDQFSRNALSTVIPEPLGVEDFLAVVDPNKWPPRRAG